MLITNPATEETSEIQETPVTAIAEMVCLAKIAQKEWASLTATQRASILAPLAKTLLSNELLLARSTTQDMGKPITQATRDVMRASEAVALLCNNGPAWIQEEKTPEGTRRYDPLGVVGIISPWNYPLTIPLFGIIPALIAGNSVVWKPSENAVQVSQLLARLILSLPHFPKDILQVIIGGAAQGKALTNQPVQLISFTGSTAIGKEIMATCAANLTRVQLELGGLDAAIVLDDAEVKESAQSILTMNTTNSGQICCAVKRVYVQRSLYTKFLETCAELSKNIIVGDPLDEKTMMGPLASYAQLRRVESFIDDVKKHGGIIYSGGARLNKPGFFFPSTVVSQLTAQSKLLHEESFGPILPILPFDSVEEAIELANDTDYGLTASIWTKDPLRAKELSGKLDVGVININRHGTPPPGGPWGGVKASGIGRMRSREGILEFCNLKYIVGF
jgi:acyl-CoA reductase-like NAD-dependent aldehyde dehydrogenase